MRSQTIKFARLRAAATRRGVDYTWTSGRPYERRAGVVIPERYKSV